MNTSFFIQAEGQNVSNIGDLSPISQHHGSSHRNDGNSHHNDYEEDSESNSRREDNSQSGNLSDDSRAELICSDDEGPSHRGS
jgi:hypothetical protein